MSLRIGQQRVAGVVCCWEREGDGLFLKLWKYNILTEMKTCARMLCFEVQCPCSKQHPTPTEISRNQNTSQFYSKVSQTLEVELKKQHDMHAREVDELNNQIFVLKNTVLRLEMRNHKDLQGEKELRREYNLLVGKLRQGEPQVIKKVEVIEKIKEIPVEIENNQLWEKQIAYWKTKNNEMMIQLQKTRTDKEVLQQINQNQAGELKLTKQYADSLKTKIQNLTKTIEEKDQLIKKMHAQLDYLKNNKEVVIQTKHLFPEFRQPEKVRTQTKIETVYAEKPVQKLVFVDVVKKVKQFVQPQKAVVNRIIACESRPQCDCKQNQNRLQHYKNQTNYLSGMVEKLESNITSYKTQRQNLVKVIGNQNCELNRLQTTFKLIGATSLPQQSYSNVGSTVNVTVNKIKQQKTSPRNSSITHQKRNTFKK